MAKKEATKAISEAKKCLWEFTSTGQWLDTNDGAKARETKTEELKQVKCIKEENHKVLVNERMIKERWKDYFS